MKPVQCLQTAIKSVQREWGHGWVRLSETQRQAFVRAEVLGQIARLDGLNIKPEDYHKHVDELATLTMQWGNDY